VEAVKNIASPSIRNMATIGGNIASRSGDTIPAFLMMDTSVALFNGRDLQMISLSEYIREELSFTPHILVAIYVSEQACSPNQFFYRKLGYREAFSPSVVTVAGCCITLQPRKIDFIRLAAGGGMSTPQRLFITEQLLYGETLSNELLNKAVQVIKEELDFPSDAFFSAEYKKQAAANLIASQIARIAG